MSWSHVDGHVRIDLTDDEYTVLLMAIGYGIAKETDPHLRRMFLKLTNTVNEGNPNYTRFVVPEEPVETDMIKEENEGKDGQ